MYEFVHSHLSYDQIILDQTVQLKQGIPQVVNKKDKPFQIQKKLQSNAKQKQQKINNQNSNDSTTNINPQINLINSNNINQDKQDREISEHQQYQQSHNTYIYDSDFEIYQEQFYQSIAKQSEQKQKPLIKIPQIDLKTTRKNNYSAIIPRINKIQPTKSTQIPKQKPMQILNRYKNKTKMQNINIQYLAKSTVQIREDNKKLIRDIEDFRKILPLIKKNQIIITQQRQEINKMKFKQSKFFDINYQMNLDKSVQQKSDFVDNVQERIRSVDRLIHYRDNIKKKRKGFPQIGNLNVQLIQQQQFQLLKQFQQLRQHMLSKMKQVEHYHSKIQQLDKKIQSYRTLIQQLQEGQKLGKHEQLKRKKIVLEYQIQMKKVSDQEKECQIMMEITDLNNQLSYFTIQIARINQETTKLQLYQNNKNYVSQNDEKNNKNISTTDISIDLKKNIQDKNMTPKKSFQRVFKLFGRKS